MNGWPVIAVAIAALHLAVCVLLVVGGPLGVHRPRVAMLHVICFVPAALVNLLDRECPLTVAEKWARRRATKPAYDGGFIEHYLTGPLNVSPSMASALVGCLVVVPTVTALLWRLWVWRDAYADARWRTRLHP